MNPFLISAYKDSKYFCDRETESKKLMDSVLNQRNIVLISLRRLGKTGLIKHVFHLLNREKNNNLFYVDLDHTTNLNEFLNKLVNSLIKGQKKSFFDGILRFVKYLRPVISYDSLTGTPEITITTVKQEENKAAFEAVLNYLDKLNKPVIIALDEFQRINDYPEEQVEAFLRSHIQHLNNVSFIFSGSSKHLLQSMFNDHSKPFYQSADILFLEKLDKNIYTEFIADHFIRTKKKISNDVIQKGIEWADTHTFYVQFLFNSLWGMGENKLKMSHLESVIDDILESRNTLYLSYKQLLTDKQYRLLRAVAIEDSVSHPNGEAFISKYHLGSASTVNSALTTLSGKELIYQNSLGFHIYDIFQKRWFQKNYLV